MLLSARRVVAQARHASSALKSRSVVSCKSQFLRVSPTAISYTLGRGIHSSNVLGEKSKGGMGGALPLDARQEINFYTVSELFEEACAAYSNRHAFGMRVGDKFEWVTYKEFYRLVQLFRNVLVHHNVGCVSPC